MKEDSGLEGRLEGSVKLEISVNLEGRLAGRLGTWRKTWRKTRVLKKDSWHEGRLVTQRKTEKTAVMSNAKKKGNQFAVGRLNYAFACARLRRKPKWSQHQLAVGRCYYAFVWAHLRRKPKWSWHQLAVRGPYYAFICLCSSKKKAQMIPAPTCPWRTLLCICLC